jgi:hypothetical protein
MATGTPDFQLANDPSRLSWYFENFDLVFASPATGTTQVQRRWGRWHAMMEWTLLNHAQFWAINRFLARFGTTTSFLMYDPERVNPTGDATVTQLNTQGGTGIKVNGGNQVGQAINVRDVPNGLILRAGDLIQFQNTGQLIEVFADCTAAANLATIQLCQYIRASPANNELVCISFPTARMRISTPIVPEIADGPAQFGLKIELVESLT